MSVEKVWPKHSEIALPVWPVGELATQIVSEVDEVLTLPSSYKLVHRGKVRDTYEHKDFPNQLIIVATDRISTHDVVHNCTIPWKWETLTKISNFWFQYFAKHPDTAHIPTQVVSDAVLPSDFPEELKARTIVVKKLTPLPVEAIVRGYLYGSAYKGKRGNYNPETGILPTGEFVGKNLTKCSQFGEPLFTPSTKGKEDVNINFNEMVAHIRSWMQENEIQWNAEAIAFKVKSYALDLYKTANEYAKTKGIILGDTKFEFALDSEGRVVLIDETCTPDSSRFWKAETVVEWQEPESYDKQPLRDEAVRQWQNMRDEEKKTPLVFSDEAISDTVRRYSAMEKAFPVLENK